MEDGINIEIGHLYSDPVQLEIDEIFSLFTYKIVYDNWQDHSIPRENRRGYNIGSILVNPQNEPVHYALNSVGITQNSTQHAEVRLMTQYLDSSDFFDLHDFTIYTTLEPCAMCAGMMAMTRVKRTVYGQNDVEFSHALERLAFDSKSIGGYAPFPRKVISSPSPSNIRQELNKAFQEFLSIDSEKILAKFLSNDQAKTIFKNASQLFENFQVKFIENRKIFSSLTELRKK